METGLWPGDWLFIDMADLASFLDHWLEILFGL
jgi:hypothetical protein